MRAIGPWVAFYHARFGRCGQVADRVAVLYVGRVVEKRLVGEVLGAPKHPGSGLLRSPRLERESCGQFPARCHNLRRCRRLRVRTEMPAGEAIAALGSERLRFGSTFGAVRACLANALQFERACEHEMPETEKLLSARGLKKAARSAGTMPGTPSALCRG